MCSGHYTKIVRTFIAIGRWAFILSQTGLPELAARAEATTTSSSALADHKQQKPGKEGTG